MKITAELLERFESYAREMADPDAGGDLWADVTRGRLLIVDSPAAVQRLYSAVRDRYRPRAQWRCVCSIEREQTHGDW